MAKALNLSSFSCPTCRDLSSNLMKSVDAFEILMAGNTGMTAEILISTIRKIVMSAVTTEETAQQKVAQNFDDRAKQRDSQPENRENVNSSLVLDVNSVTGNVSMANNLDSDLNNLEIEQENLPNTPSGSGSNHPLFEQIVKRKRQGRPKGSKNRKVLKLRMNQTKVNSNRQAKPRRSEKKAKKVTSTDLDLMPDKAEADSRSKTADFHGRQPIKNRPIATKEDFIRAAEYVKKFKVDTDDGLYYYLYECSQCSQQFPNYVGNQNARVHVVAIHLNKHIVRKSTKTELQLAADKIRNSSGRPVKIQLIGKRKQSSEGTKTLDNRKGRLSRVIQIDSNSVKSEIPSNGEKTKPPGVRSQKSKNRSTGASTSSSLRPYSRSTASSSLSKFSIPFPIPIPPNLTVRNPCTNFDLERAMNVRVCVELTPNLANIRRGPSAQRQIATTANGESDVTLGHRDEVVEADLNTIEDAKMESPRLNSSQVLGLYSSSPGNQGGEIMSVNNMNGSSSCQMLTDVLSDLIEMDVDTIMKMQL